MAGPVEISPQAAGQRLRTQTDSALAVGEGGDGVSLRWRATSRRSTCLHSLTASLGHKYTHTHTMFPFGEWGPAAMPSVVEDVMLVSSCSSTGSPVDWPSSLCCLADTQNRIGRNRAPGNRFGSRRNRGLQRSAVGCSKRLTASEEILHCDYHYYSYNHHYYYYHYHYPYHSYPGMCHHCSGFYRPINRCLDLQIFYVNLHLERYDSFDCGLPHTAVERPGSEQLIYRIQLSMLAALLCCSFRRRMTDVESCTQPYQAQFSGGCSCGECAGQRGAAG